jgi:hypothetical protein
MQNKITPIFIFSLPRAGSTLLQRILGADKSIGFSGEPWILLPFFYSMKGRGVVSEYNHTVMSQGIQSFTDYMQGGEGAYYREIKMLAERLYRSASKDSDRYFIDKTPRYHFIVDEILKVFDDAKFIFLWRHPLAVPASCIETWGAGKWNAYYFECDLYGGLERLVSAYEANQDRAWAINYEALVGDPEAILSPLFEDYLQMRFNPEILTKFGKLELKGRMWDPTGVKMYSSVDTRPLEKWKATMSGFIRKRWCHNYLNWIGEKRLGIMGYNMEKLQSEVDDLPVSFSELSSDVIRMAHGKVCRQVEGALFKGNMPFLTK